MKKILLFLLAVIFFVSVVSAEHYVYGDRIEHYPLVKQNYLKHYTIQTSDNSDCMTCNKHYDYKKDYTYADYHERNKFLMEKNKENFKDFSKVSYTRFSKERDYKYSRDIRKKDYYYVYNEAMRKLEEKECYHQPPKDRLFYIKCPN